MNTNRSLSTFRFNLALLAFCALSACSTKEEVVVPTPDPTVLQLKLQTGQQLNPDIEGRASPLVVRIYQFDTIDKFNTSDFFAIYDNDEALLGKSLQFRRELELQPGSSQEITLIAKPEARYLAVFAAFRNLDTAQWRASMPIALHQTTTAVIQFDRYTVALTPQNNN